MEAPDRRRTAGAETERIPWHRLTAEEVLRQLGNSPQGLSTAEAEARLRRFGRNELARKRDYRLLRSFLSQFTHLMAVLLWAGAGIALAIHLPELAIAIVAVILVNGVFSFLQEYRAERATEALSRLLPRTAVVIRDGTPRQIPSAQVVPGDLLVLSEGDVVPADARLIEAHLLAVDNAALTGESVPAPRESAPMEQDPDHPAEATNLVFAGTQVVSGRGTAVVLATGARTAFGAIAELSRSVPERPSPLQREMRAAVRTITLVAVIVGIAISLLARAVVGLDAGTALTFALGLIVAFVPEGLLPTLTLSLAMGVQRMARRRALVKHLAAVEALGSATVIATDKTGVLTQNRMMVVRLFADGRELEVTGEGYAPTGEIREGGRPLTGPERESLLPLLRVAALCNYARLTRPSRPGETWGVRGDPTEGALQALAAKAGVRVEELLRQRRLVAEWPFDARRQRMTVAYPAREGLLALTKGAPEAVLERCTRVRIGGTVRPLGPAERAAIEEAYRRFAAEGLRVLALAERPLRHEELDDPPEAVERELTFLGLVAMHDPPRPEVPEAVRRCRSAGIRIYVVSGDQGSTVAAIARQVGIVREGARIVEGRELASMSDDALRELLGSGQEVVFARTPPEGKLRVVRTLQSLDHVVAVTGDGVNDAPALQQADIGVAMGLSGTEVARATADMVLADDNFASIVAAVEEGRAAFDNIRKFTAYCFTSNAAEAIPFIVFVLSGGRVPLALPVMLVLAVDVGTDLLPALALGAEPPEPDVMERPPRSRTERLITPGLLLRALGWLGVLEGAAGMAAFAWVYRPGAAALLPRARAATFAGIVLAQVANLFVCRSERPFAFLRRGNPLLLPGLAAELGLLLAILYVPFLQRFFGTAGLTSRDWLLPLIVPPIFLLLGEAGKAIGIAAGSLRRPVRARVAGPGPQAH